MNLGRKGGKQARFFAFLPRSICLKRTTWKLGCRWLVLFTLACGFGVQTRDAHADSIHAGPLFDEFDLTLAPGHRTEVLGPLFYDQEKETEHTWAVPPLLSLTRDPAVPLKEFDFLYPVLTYDRYGDQYRWQFFQALAFAGGPTQTATNRHRFTLFPLYFRQRSSASNDNYTAVFPFYGHLKHRLFRDEIFFVMFPAYGRTRKKDVVTYNYFYPFFHRRYGDGLRGWQFWPVMGREHKAITTRTNTFNEVQTVAGHDNLFVMWPFFFSEKKGIGTDNPQWMQASLPAYALVRSPKRDSTTILWPFFNHITDREKKYREWDAPWPLIEFARGEGKHTTRVWPFFSHAHSPTLEDNFYLWPVWKYTRANLPPLDRERRRILFFLYSDITDKNTETGTYRRRTDLWPFFVYHRDFNGNSRLQVLALVESFLAGSHKIERDYSPVWSLWRSQKNRQTSAASQSLLWNLYRWETAPEHKRISCLFGLFQYQAAPTGKRVRVFYIPFGKKPAEQKAEG